MAMAAVRDEETEDENLLHERLPPTPSRACSLVKLALAFSFFVVCAWSAIYMIRHANSGTLQEYVDSQCVSDFSAKEFESYLSTISIGGDKVCTLEIRSARLPMRTRVALLGVAGTDDVRNIVNIGTRISTMSVECDPARARTYPKECVSEHGFYFASLADYRNDVQRVIDGRIYTADKIIVLIINPFDAAYRIYRRKKACDGLSMFRFMCDLDKSPKITTTELMTPAYFDFTRNVFAEWVRFMEKVDNITTLDKTFVYMDDLINIRKRAEVAADIYETIYDDLLSPSVEDSVTCLMQAEQDAHIFPMELNKGYTAFYSNSSMEELCLLAKPFWDSSRWKNECK